MSSLFYFFKESLQGFARNLSTTLGSIITIFLSLLIIGVFLVGGTIVERLVSSIEDEVSITAYVADDAPQESIDAVTAMIQGMDGVESVGFTTKEQALENFSNSMTTNPEIIEQLDGTNPLPASIDVSLADPQKVDEIAAAIEADETFRSICDEPDNPADSLKYGQKTVDRLFSVTKYVRYLGVALVLLLVFIALVFINNTIRLAIMARRKEIAIMRLVGASNGFIRGPFLMEGALHAITAAGGLGVPTVKPWDRDTVFEKLEAVRKADPVAVAMDIDGAGLPFLQNRMPPAGSKTVAELREIIEFAKKPFILKGIMTPNGARKAMEAGAAGIVVSNHGGRVLDQCPATAEVLPGIADAVGGRMKIFVDGGIRTGLDVFKALALGADGVLIGRPFVTMVYGGGAEGVQVYVNKLQSELKDAMQMCGVHSLDEIGRDQIFRP